MQTRDLVFLLLGALLFRAAVTVADDLTITTYYPSPYGVYDKIRTRQDTYLSINGGKAVIGGNTLGDATLLVAGNVQIQDGTEGDGKVLTSDAWGVAKWKDGGGTMPSGAVMFFARPACPADWSPWATAQGRYLVGLPPGGTLGGGQGIPLSNLENRPVGQHAHGIIDPGHSHHDYFSGGGPKARTAPFFTGSVARTNAVTRITVRPEGTRAGTNAPYVQLLVCIKD